MLTSGVITTESIFNDEGLEIKQINYMWNSDSLGTIISSYQNMWFEKKYNDSKNLVEYIQYSAFDSLPIYKNEYFYDENSKIIQIKKYRRQHNCNWEERHNGLHIKSCENYYWKFSVDKWFHYNDSLLSKYTFKSSSDSLIKRYIYNDKGVLNKIIEIDKNLKYETTYVELKSDTLIYTRIDSLNNEYYRYYEIKDDSDRLTEYYVLWKTPRSDYGYKYYYDKRGLLIKEEQFTNDGRGILRVFDYTYD